MLSFHSANVRIVNSERAIAECFEIAFPEGVPGDCRAIVVNATLGHKLDRLAAAALALAPGAAVYGTSCCGVVGRMGVGESMHEVGIMAISGPEHECVSAAVRDIRGDNARERGLDLARALHAKSPDVTTVYLLCPGIDISNDLVLEAFEEVFGPGITIYGGTSSDNMRGLMSHQYHDGLLTEHDAWAIGFADPTLRAVTRATHGFTAYGEPLVVTEASGNRIVTFNGKPAWEEYLRRLNLPADATGGDSIPIGALAEKLPPEQAEEYGNEHILRVITKYDPDGSIYAPITVRPGMEFWLTVRDEELIFSEQRRSLEYITGALGGHEPVAVFQTDCLARGRFLFNKVVKDEIIAMMQSALGGADGVPPWLGMYGFGEYAKLGGRNAYHNYSTALMALYR